jgi:rare lipoprotein A
MNKETPLLKQLYLENTRRWRDILIVILSFLVIAEATFLGVYVKEKPAPVVKREVIEKLQIIERVVIAKTHESGIASWYGKPEHGRTTASGTTYNMYDMTVAHPTLPFGTKLLVFNRTNGKSVIVEVTDRLPKVWTKPQYGRVIDMSYASAKKLGMVMDGVVPVEVMVLEEYHENINK